MKEDETRYVMPHLTKDPGRRMRPTALHGGAAANLDICRHVSCIRDPAFEGAAWGQSLSCPALDCDWLSRTGSGGGQGTQPLGSLSPLTGKPKRRGCSQQKGQLSLLAIGRRKGCWRQCHVAALGDPLAVCSDLPQCDSEKAVNSRSSACLSCRVAEGLTS